MDPSKHSEKDLCELRCSLRRERTRFRRLKSCYLELKKANPELHIDFFEDTLAFPQVTLNKAIPEDRLQKELIDELARVMADLLRFMSRYDHVQAEHPEFKISFIESIKNQYVTMS
ncbi:MAG: hypothetical protein WCR01_13275 [Bacteroidota bacterium]